jgi:hypothetical protein
LYNIPDGWLKPMSSTPSIFTAEKSAFPAWEKATAVWCGNRF